MKKYTNIQLVQTKTRKMPKSLHFSLAWMFSDARYWLPTEYWQYWQSVVALGLSK